jgi:ABC-2 type transport system ATP-binding protein
MPLSRDGTLTERPAIETKGLTRRFGATVAVNGLDLVVYLGEVFGFLGHNGAGKTTTVRLLSGVLAPTAGEVRVLGLSPIADGPAVRRRIGVLTETAALDDRLTVRETLTVFADLYGVPRREVSERIGRLLAAFDLPDRVDALVGSLSKGLRQRLALARTLLHGPEVIFLDEPTSGLDPVSGRQVRDLVVHLSRAERRTVFLCTHNLFEAQQVCDRVAVLERGRVVALGTTAELARKVGGGFRLEIEVAPDDAGRAAEVLRSVVGVEAVTVEADVLVLGRLDRERVPDVVRLLASHGVRVYRVAPFTPSLEDVYLALHQQGGAP